MESNIVNSIFPDFPVPKDVSFVEFLFGQMEEDDSVFMTCASTGNTFTRGEVVREAQSFSAGLRNLPGLTYGDVIAVIVPNCVQYLSIVAGISASGFIPTLMNTKLTIDELEAMVSEVEAKVVIGPPSLISEWISRNESRPILIQFSVDSSTTKNKDVLSYEQIVAESRSDRKSFKFDKIDGSNLTALILWSSGTTGLPKGVEITHVNVIAGLLTKFYNTEMCSGKETFHSVIPFYHIYGLMYMLLIPFYSKCRVVSFTTFQPAAYISSIKQFQPTVLALVPPLAELIANSQELSCKDFEHTRLVLVAGATCRREMIQKLREKITPEVVLKFGYGMTESLAGGTTSLRFLGPPQYESVGSLIATFKAKIVDTCTGEALGAGKEGEVCFKSSVHIMKGYYKRDKETAKVIDSEGWLHTGDVGFFDYNSPPLLHISGRIKDIIKCNGYQVSPNEIEAVIMTVDTVKAAVVVGVSHDVYGEVPKAFVVPADKLLTKEKIQDVVSQKLAKHKQLIGGIVFLDSIPVSAAGKVLRHHLQNTRE